MRPNPQPVQVPKPGLRPFGQSRRPHGSRPRDLKPGQELIGPDGKDWSTTHRYLENRNWNFVFKFVWKPVPLQQTTQWKNEAAEAAAAGKRKRCWPAAANGEVALKLGFWPIGDGVLAMALAIGFLAGLAFGDWLLAIWGFLAIGRLAFWRLAQKHAGPPPATRHQPTRHPPQPPATANRPPANSQPGQPAHPPNRQPPTSQPPNRLNR